MMQNCFRFKNPILLMALAATYPVVAHSVPAARIDFAAGPVIAVSASGAQRPLTKGAEISSGDTVQTGNEGRAQLRFSDGAVVSLQPQTEFRIDDYYYSGRNDGKEKSFLNLLKGGLRTITGLIGKGNQDAYRVTTQVATIGIRGTEYSASYTSSSSDSLIVHTGEGRIEVCNAGGCVAVANGESALISGQGQTPARTESRPRLAPAQPPVTNVVEVTATGETRTVSGGVAPVSPPLTSGLHAVALRGEGANGSLTINSGAAVFGPNSELLSYTSGFDTFSAQTVKGAFSADGVIGWGIWSSGTHATPYSSPDPLTNVHYVVGQVTSASDITALQAANFSATYQLIGFTLPTAQGNIVGQAPSGSLTANFGGSISVGLNLSVPINGTTHALTGSGFSYTGSTFNGYGNQSLSFEGFFAGSNASHAGLKYWFDGGAIGVVTGAAAFKR